MKRKLLLSVLGLVAVSVVGFYYYTTTPTYSVLQIRNAVQDHDVALFEKHVDVDTLFNRLIDDVMAQALFQTASSCRKRYWPSSTSMSRWPANRPIATPISRQAVAAAS